MPGPDTAYFPDGSDAPVITGPTAENRVRRRARGLANHAPDPRKRTEDSLDGRHISPAVVEHCIDQVVKTWVNVSDETLPFKMLEVRSRWPELAKALDTLAALPRT